MSINFPVSLDTSVTIPAEGASTPLSTNHVTAHQNIQDAIEVIEAKIGIDSSAVTTSHDYKLSEITGSDKAVGKTATQTLTNKTLTSPTVTGATITASTINGVTIQTAGSATDFLAANGTYQTGSVANASTTVKGISELATSAEITAGTATGGTGAALVVTPDALASSTPVFNGSGLTNISTGLIAASATAFTTTNTSTETTAATISIPGGTLGTNKAIKITMLVSASWADGGTITFRVKYGGTTIYSLGINPTGTPTQTMYAKLDIVLQADGTTSSQESYGSYIQTGEASGATPAAGIISDTTSSIDSTTSQNLIITTQNESSGASESATIKSYVVHRLV